MENIENTYVDYDEIIREFTEDVVRSRFEQIYEEMKEFIINLNIGDVVKINDVILMQALMDYFSDVYRLKKYHKIQHINSIKIKAYESFWLVHRKPIQIVADQLEDDKMIYVNEKFVLSRLVCFLLEDNINTPMVEGKLHAFQNFLDTFYYYLKFRRSDAQSIEMLLLAFKAGQLISNNVT